MSLSLFSLRINLPSSPTLFTPKICLFQVKNPENYSDMKLDAKAIRYLTNEDFKVLAGVLISPSTPPSPALSR